MTRRYTARPLPQTAYIPGMSARGERPAALPARATAIDFDKLGEDDDFRYGVDLFNHGFPWEAHEAWESLWLVAPRDRAERTLLQGLIHAAAAVVKAKAGNHAAARGFIASACEYLTTATTPWLDARTLIEVLREWAGDPARAAPTIELAG